MKELVSYRLPPRDETVVTLYDEHLVEITQTSPLGEERDPIQINSWDLADLIGLLDEVRRYKVPESKPPLPKPLESVAGETAEPTLPPKRG